jgi:hypothetical protein
VHFLNLIRTADATGRGRRTRAARRRTAVGATAGAALLLSLAAGLAPGASAAPEAAPGAPPACASIGTTTVSINGTATPVCQRYFPTGAAIRLPADTDTERYGVVQAERAARSQLRLRAGQSLPLDASVIPPAPAVGLGGRKAFAQIIFRATVRNGVVTALTPRLFVPIGTHLNPYMGRTFIGTVENVPTPGTTLTVPRTEVVRWDFGYGNANGRLTGRFVNLTNSIRETAPGARFRSCLTALLGGDPVRTAWYRPVLGTSDRIALEWDPAMHGAIDSELVITLGSGVSFMAGSPRLDQLMTGNIDPSAEIRFGIHGTPHGYPATFTGRFRPWESSQYCSPR